MSNVWIKKKEQVYMPTNLTEDREVEFTFIRRSQVQRLRDYWRWHRNEGSIDEVEYRSLLAVIEFQEFALYKDA